MESLTPANPEYESPEETFGGIVAALSCITDKARELGIHVVFGTCFQDDMTGDVTSHAEWNSLLAAGTIITHIQGRLTDALSGYAYAED